MSVSCAVVASDQVLWEGMSGRFTVVTNDRILFDLCAVILINLEVSKVVCKRSLKLLVARQHVCSRRNCVVVVSEQTCSSEMFEASGSCGSECRCAAERFS